MFSQRVWRLIGVLAAVVVLTVALIAGFGAGFSYTRLQERRQEALEAAANDNGETGTGTQEGGAATEYEPRLVTRETPGSMMLYVELGDNTSEIGQKLEEMGVIENVTLWTIMSRINGYDGQYKSGTHYVTKDMNFDELMWNLTQQPSTVRITFREGLNYLQVKEVLRTNGIIFNEDELDRLMNTPSEFLGYDLVTGIPANVPGRDWMLEGYLFPDTYNFDVNASEKRIIETFLSNMERRFNDGYRERAEYLGMTTDEIITLASVIEMESSRSNERYIVSRVFYNRMEQDMLLQSCATVNYLRAQVGKPPVFIVTSEDMKMDSEYNTYLYDGLPPGPIANPSLESLRAALYPDTENTDVLYFAAIGNGANVFARTYEEHERNIEEYVIPAQRRFEMQQADQGRDNPNELPPEVQPPSTWTPPSNNSSD